MDINPILAKSKGALVLDARVRLWAANEHPRAPGVLPEVAARASAERNDD